MRTALFLIPLALSSAACSSPAEMAREAGVKGGGRSTPTATAFAPASPVSVKTSAARDGGSWEFEYGWPAQVSAQPALARILTAERDQALASEKAEWAGTLADAPPDCTACRSRGYVKRWKVVADIPGYLSLSAQTDTFTGGAHGMYSLQSLVWDKAAKRAVDGAALFASPAALDAALGDRLCAALDAQRAKKRGEPVRPPVEGDAGFSACQRVADATVLIGSSTGRAFDRVGIWFGPYVAGPYAEGAYELNFPIDAAVLRAVKPEYAKAFAVGR